ncbi:MAG: PH domain-containing protein [Candidatus Methanomethyliaceae archaeon]|nr:PH domain-containing protein [Candidatus Methanomethyliaceae archaeon]MDW7971175.1 PH domain-containing protein [Nitrososphaerota archaeon]
MVVIPLFIVGFGIISYSILIGERTIAMIFVILYILPLTIITIFISYWIPKFYESIKYQLTETEVRVERGVWWKMRHAVPYSRIMSLDTIQGPISRRFGIGTVDIYTAGYTGRAGGGGGFSTRRAEASIMHISNFLELREEILNIVKERALFSFSSTPLDIIAQQILEELRGIRKLLSS